MSFGENSRKENFKMAKFSEGMSVKTEIPTRGEGIKIITINSLQEVYNHDKVSQPGRFLFGTVLGGPYEEHDGQRLDDQKYLVRLAGKKYRTTLLPGRVLTSARK